MLRPSLLSILAASMILLLIAVGGYLVTNDGPIPRSIPMSRESLLNASAASFSTGDADVVRNSEQEIFRQEQQENHGSDFRPFGLVPLRKSNSAHIEMTNRPAAPAAVETGRDLAASTEGSIALETPMDPGNYAAMTLRSAPSSSGSAISTSAKLQDHGERSAELSTRVPLAFIASEVGISGMTAEQEQDLRRIQDEFVKEIGGSKADPNDPGYAKRWSDAVPRSDGRIRLFFGDEFANKVQLAAAQAAQAARDRLSSH